MLSERELIVELGNAYIDKIRKENELIDELKRLNIYIEPDCDEETCLVIEKILNSFNDNFITYLLNIVYDYETEVVVNDKLHMCSNAEDLYDVLANVV